MNRIRLLLFSTITWLFFVINLEEFIEQTSISFLNINPMIYVLLAGIFIAFLILSNTNDLMYKITIFSIPFSYLAISIFSFQGSEPLESTLINNILEIAVLGISVFLARELGAWFANYEIGVKNSIFKPTETLVNSIFSDVEKIEKRISRARRFENELALVYVNLKNALIYNVDKEQLSAYLAETLQIIETPGVINAWNEDTLMICVPASIHSTQVYELIQNLTYVVQDVLNAANELHVASFPRNGLVLSDLLRNVSIVDKGKQYITAPNSPIFYNLEPKFKQIKLQVS